MRVHVDKDSGQTILSGMGELHLEIVISRLLSHYNVACTTGLMSLNFFLFPRYPIHLLTRP